MLPGLKSGDSRPMQERDAVCASHPARPSIGTCARCGRFCCEACAKTAPGLECQVVQRQAARRLSPRLVTAIGVFVALYCLCTVLTPVALAPIDFLKLTPKNVPRAELLFLAAVETVYLGAGLGLMVVFLVWYGKLIDWAKGRGFRAPSNGVALACWFVPFVNLVHPFLTVNDIRKDGGVRTPVGWWWSLFVISIVLSTIGSGRVLHGGYAS